MTDNVTPITSGRLPVAEAEIERLRAALLRAARSLELVLPEMHGMRSRAAVRGIAERCRVEIEEAP
jgi:hypothetical protein